MELKLFDKNRIVWFDEFKDTCSQMCKDYDFSEYDLKRIDSILRCSHDFYSNLYGIDGQSEDYEIVKNFLEIGQSINVADMLGEVDVLPVLAGLKIYSDNFYDLTTENRLFLTEKNELEIPEYYQIYKDTFDIAKQKQLISKDMTMDNVLDAYLKEYHPLNDSTKEILCALYTEDQKFDTYMAADPNVLLTENGTFTVSEIEEENDYINGNLN